MEEFRRAAIAFYEHLPAKDKKLARKKFKAMDKSGDGQISRREYEKYLKKKKVADLTLQSLFRAVGKDDNASLEFEEAFFLHYIMQSGRAIICMSCKTFMEGAYFSCSQCFFKDASVSTFDICCDCYGGKKFSHEHDGTTFCDNCTLLRQSRSAIKEPPITKRRKVFKILKKGLQIGSIIGSLGSIITTFISWVNDDGDSDGDGDGDGGDGGDHGGDGGGRATS